MDLQTLRVPVLADITKFMKDIDKASSAASNIGKNMAIGGAALTVAAIPVTKFFKSAISGASDMSEQLAKTNQVFDESAGGVESWSKTMSTSFGISKLEALEYAGNFGNIFTQMGLADDMSAQYSQGLVELSADQGAFNNMPTEDVLNKINSAMVGNYKGVKDLGIVLNATMVKEKAFEMGLADANGEVSQGALVQARYALMVEQSSNAMGQFERESEGLAAQTKINQAKFADLKATLGEQLLPIVIKITGKISELLDVFTNMSPTMQKVVLIAGGLFVALGPVLVVIGSLITAISTVSAFLAGPAVAAVLAFMAPFLPWILLIVAVIAVIYLLVSAWKNDFGGIRTWITKAIQDIVEWFKNLWTSIINIATAIGEKLVGPVTTIVDWFTKFWKVVKIVAEFIGGMLVRALNAVKGVINGVTRAVNSLKNALRNLSLPSWLTPGSPTPLELGLKGINKQFKLAAKSTLPKFSTELNMNSNINSKTKKDSNNNKLLINAINNSKQKIDYVKMATVFRDTVLQEMA